ncbi:hypothetical protein LZK73_16060 [Neorhizobium galegae]|nr:hypothetical protein LZK73_16060 [Neorhizobium galegae]
MTMTVLSNRARETVGARKRTGKAAALFQFWQECGGRQKCLIHAIRKHEYYCQLLKHDSNDHIYASMVPWQKCNRRNARRPGAIRAFWFWTGRAVHGAERPVPPEKQPPPGASLALSAFVTAIDSLDRLLRLRRTVPHPSPIAIRLALPPAAAVLTEITCSSANRIR